MTVVTSRELKQQIGYAKESAKSGPVFITHWGRPAHVPLSIEDYRRLAGQRRSLVEALSMPGLADVDFDLPRIRVETLFPIWIDVSAGYERDLRVAQVRRW